MRLCSFLYLIDIIDDNSILVNKKIFKGKENEGKREDNN